MSLIRIAGRIACRLSLSVLALTALQQAAEAAGPGSMARNLDKTQLYLKEGIATLAPFAHVRFCMTSPRQCEVTDGADVIDMTAQVKDRMAAINVSVNKAIRPLADPPGQEVWIVGGAAGSCHDYAVTKRKELLEAGFSSKAVRLAVAFTGDGQGHAVVVVRTNQGDMVLDNRTSAIRRWDRTDLRWVKIESTANPRFWVSL
jgi:predicted transglutaminase-like cysteine proteinase